MRSRSLYSALLIFLFSSLAIVSCKKDLKNEDVTIPNPTTRLPYPAPAPVTGSITGMVVDENNTPVDAAEVSFGSTVTATDARGIFSFENVTMDKYITTVIVNRPGYFKGYRSFSASASRNYLSIKLTKKTLSGTVNSSAAGNVALSNGTNLSFQANSMVVKSSGAPYTGTVNVYATYIDPTASDIAATVPGSFMGRDADNLYALQSTGMIAVELESTTGEALQLASGLPATVRMPIPASIGSKAPSVINTWSLNDQGIWQKEGSASKSGDFYDMQVTHFSFWNCDVPANSTYLTIHVQDQNGNALQNVLVSLSIPNNTSWWGTTYGYTDGNGNVSGVIPADVVMLMQVYPDAYSSCGAAYSQNVGPFTSNSSITVTATFPNSQEVIVSGTATDCNNQPLQNGTAIIYLNQYNYYYVPVINGSYSDTLPHCVTISSLNVSVFDAANNLGSSGTVAAGGNNVTVPNITVCGTQAAVFTFGNIQGFCSINYSGSYITGTPLNGSNLVTIDVNVSTPGSYSITTAPAGGINFSATGIFTTVGVQQVVLTGTGTPTLTGYYTFFPQANTGISGCTFGIGVQDPPAGIDIGSGTCPGLSISGTYAVGFFLTSNNTVTLTVNATSPGSYFITTNNDNGISFSDSGTITTTGIQTIVLQGNGTPIIAGNNIYTLQYNGVSGCSFTLNTINSSNANYVFVGAPGNCQQASVVGNYDNDSTLTAQHYVYLMVDVASPGTYNIITNTTNGIYFAGSGIFTSGGTNFVILQGYGQPVNTGTYTYIPTDGSIVGCAFMVNVVD